MKTVIVIFFATLSASIGEVLLSYGMKRNGEVNIADPAQWVNLIMQCIRNPYIIGGVALLAVFFFLYLASLSWADISFVLPLTAMSFIFAAVMAKYFLREDVSWYRWAGTFIIVVGIIIAGLDQKQSTTSESVMTNTGAVNAGGQDIVGK